VASAEDLARTIHAHPTMSEAVKEAALPQQERDSRPLIREGFAGMTRPRFRPSAGAVDSRCSDILKRITRRFQPFIIPNVDGREFTVRIPEFILLAPHGIAVVDHEGDINTIRLTALSSNQGAQRPEIPAARGPDSHSLRLAGVPAGASMRAVFLFYPCAAADVDANPGPREVLVLAIPPAISGRPAKPLRVAFLTPQYDLANSSTIFCVRGVSAYRRSASASALFPPLRPAARRGRTSAFLRRRVTFTVYHDHARTESIFLRSHPGAFIPNREWATDRSPGLIPGSRAHNLFLFSMTSITTKCLKDKIVPAATDSRCEAFPARVHALHRARGIYVHTLRNQTDLIRDAARANTSCSRTTSACPSGAKFT